MESNFTFDLAGAAKFVGVSIPKMRELAHKPGFPAIRVGRRWVIPRMLLKEWLEEEAKKGIGV